MVRVQLLNITHILSIQFTTFPPNVVEIGQINGSSFFKLRECGSLYFSTRVTAFFDTANAFYIGTGSNITKFCKDFSIILI
jgi:hypothetical protein